MFDKLYVLAKGGLCVYSGPPQDLNTHLNECQIQCNQFQVPIEVLLKTATKGINDEQVLQLALKTTEDKQILINKLNNETKLVPNGIQFKSKNFKLTDLWYLSMRTMTYTYISQWKLLLIQLLIYIISPLLIARVFNKNIGKADGCFSFNMTSNHSCIEQLEQNSILEQTMKFHASTAVIIMLIQLCVTTLSFPADIKIFMNEHQNSKSLKF
jgi:hypothetical protein